MTRVSIWPICGRPLAVGGPSKNVSRFAPSRAPGSSNPWQPCCTYHAPHSCCLCCGANKKVRPSMKMHWDGRKCFLRFIRGTTQLDRHDAYPLCAGARTCFLDNGRTRLSLPAPPDLRPFRPRRFGKARSGVICHQAVLTGLTPSPARFPRLVLRRPHPCAFPFIIAAFSPFCKGDLQIFQGALPLDPSARLS